MTQAASILQEMEALAAKATNPAKAQAEHPTDAIFRQVLRAAYDPYRQYGFSEVEWGFEPITDTVLADKTLEEEWQAFESALADLEEGAEDVRRELLNNDGEGAEWRNSPAWPVYQRVLMKRLDGVQYADVYSVWMDLPRFMPGKWSEQDPEEYPVFVEPIFPDHHRIVIVRPPRIDVFKPDGTYCRERFPRRYRSTLKELNFKVWLEDGTFNSGIVLDGYEQRDAPFLIFDVVPLKRFREQKSTEPYEDRRGRLEALNAIIIPGHDQVRGLISTRCDNEQAVCDLMKAQLRDTEEREQIRGFVAKNPRLSYPYTPGEAWCRIQLEAEDAD